MKIESSTIGMDSARSYTSETKMKTYVVSAGIGKAQGREQGSYTFSQLLENAEEESMQAEAKRLLLPEDSFRNSAKLSAEKRVGAQTNMRSLESFREACIRFLIRWLYDGLGMEKGRSSAMQFSAMESEYFHYEAEDTEFQTTGTVVTSDGRQIDFQLSLGMSRRFAEYMGVSSISQAVQMTDPLIINFDAPAAGVSDQRFEFDIDTDGVKDSLPLLAAGSGFLALDKNGDGRINDGSELFGTKSGDGFSDLAEYDSDGNGWIDENDPVFDKLLIWHKDESGQDSLYTLKQSGVGALYLMKAPTEFTLGESDQNAAGRIRSTGIFLYENGNVGTMQQVDLAG